MNVDRPRVRGNEGSVAGKSQSTNQPSGDLASGHWHSG